MIPAIEKVLARARTNVHGGAIAIGHPLGASGARIMTTLVNALVQRDGRYAFQTMCEGGSIANAMIIERLDSRVYDERVTHAWTVHGPAKHGHPPNMSKLHHATRTTLFAISCATAVVGLLAGCGSSEDAEQPGETGSATTTQVSTAPATSSAIPAPAPAPVAPPTPTGGAAPGAGGESGTTAPATGGPASVPSETTRLPTASASPAPAPSGPTGNNDTNPDNPVGPGPGTENNQTGPDN